MYEKGGLVMSMFRIRRLIALTVLVAVSLLGQAQVTSPPSATPSRETAVWVEPQRDEPAGMRYKTFHSAAAGREVSYLIYLPPDYDTATAKRYPSVYWLHGLNGRQTGGSRLAARVDHAIRAGEMPGVIVVSVNGLRASMYTNSKDGERPVETVIVKDLVSHVDATYRTIARREARAIEGMSMGGYGALRLGFKYPEVFGVVSSYAAALHTENTLAERRRPIFAEVFDSDRDYGRPTTPWAIVKQNADKLRGQTIRLIIGTADGLLEWNREYHALLNGLEVEHEYTEIEGVAHNYRELEEKTADATIEFYREAFAELAE